MNSQVYFENIREKIIEVLNTCEFDLKIAVAWFTDKKLLSKVEELSRRGVEVQILVYDDHINQKQLYEKLYYSEAKIFFSKKLMHNKFCIIDGKTVVNGSYNWTYTASVNEENIMIINEFKAVSSFVNKFQELFHNQNQEISFYFKNQKEKYENEFESFLQKNKFPDFPFIYKVDFKRSKILNLFFNFKKVEQIQTLYLLIDSIQDLKPLFEILKTQKKLIYLPMRFFLNIYGLNDNDVFFELEEDLLVEDENKSNGRTIIYLISRVGEIISEKVYIENKYTTSTGETFFVSKGNGIYRIYDIKLNYKEIKCSTLWFENDLIFTKGLTGVFKADGTEILPVIYNRIRKKGLNTYILESSPFLRGCRYFVSRDTDNFYEEHFEFNSETLKLNQIIYNSNPDLHYLSDDNGKWVEFYPKFLNLKYNIVKELKIRFKESTSSEIREELDDVISEMIIEIDNKKSNKEGCYVATMVYQDYNHPKVLSLRALRDNILLKYRFGKWFVNKYYKYSPKFVERFKDTIWVKPIGLVIKLLVFLLESFFWFKR